MINFQDVVHIGYVKSVNYRDKTVSCLLTSIGKEVSIKEFVVFSFDNILVPWRVIEWQRYGQNMLTMKLKFIDTDKSLLQFVHVPVYLLASDVDAKELSLSHSLQTSVGYKLIDEQQGYIGVIDKIDTTSANTLVQTQEGVILPLLDEFVVSVDEVHQKISVCLPFNVSELKP